MKGRRTDLGQADCAIARSLQVIGDWWSLLIVRQAFLGVQRFGEFQTTLGLAKNILSTRLRKLVDEGILKVEPNGAQTKRHRYVLTEKGERLHVVLIALWQWGEESCFGDAEMTSALVDSRDRRVLAKLEPRAADGTPIGSYGFALVPKSAVNAP